MGVPAPAKTKLHCLKRRKIVFVLTLELCLYSNERFIKAQFLLSCFDLLSLTRPDQRFLDPLPFRLGPHPEPKPRCEGVRDIYHEFVAREMVRL